jgi:V/A-type H+-transporting ATPase subunit I
MSIVRLKRLTVAGLVNEQHGVLAHLQTLGCIHLLPLRPAPATPETAPAPHAVDALRALRYLGDVPQKRRQVRNDRDFDMQGTVALVLDNQVRLRELSDRRDALQQRHGELAPWGDFSFPSDDALAGQKLWFYVLPLNDKKALDGLDLPWQVAHRDNRHWWVVVVSPDEPPVDLLPVPRTHTGSLSLSEVEARLDSTELALEEVIAERIALTRWIYLIARHLAEAEDQAGLDYAASLTFEDEALFLVHGWIPVDRVADVQAYADAEGIALLVEEPTEQDAPPTLLDNPPALQAGQDLVGFYQVPAYDGWDPSRVLFFSFTVFFAMILSDAGYALLLGALLALGWRRLGGGDVGRRLRVLGAALVGGSVAWGVLVGSYFGFAPAPGSLLDAVAVLDINDFETMMRLSVGLGVLHLVVANLEMALNRPDKPAGRIAIGWIAVLCGGYLAWLAGTETTLGGMGLWVIGGGLLAVFLLGSDRRVTGAKSLLLRVLDGLRALTELTKVFGDALSYLRLFALGLASGSLALTFNGLARQVADEVEGLGLLFAILILLVGHLLNLALGIMSGVVHGLRLNFIEFYNWALAGEGYPFKPFKKTELKQ